MSRRIVTIIQARTGSQRLPGKVMLPLAGKPLLIRMIERVKASPLSGFVAAAIPQSEEDDVLNNLCIKNDIKVFRGSNLDLLDRHYKAGLHFNADAVVKIPSDCPLIDPDVITKVISYYLNSDFDYVSNLHPPSYPDGNDVEIFSMTALEKAYNEAELQMEREHATPYFWENPDLFSIGNVVWETGLDYSMSERWTIDYMEDYLFIKSIYDELYSTNPQFGISEILALLNEKPQLRKINQKYAGVNWYRDHLHQLKTIKPGQTKII